MADFTLKRREAKTLKIHIDDQTYEIPLSGSLRPKEVAKLDTVDATMEFMKRYIPAEVIDDLTQDEYNDIVKAWGKASNQEAGIKTGE